MQFLSYFEFNQSRSEDLKCIIVIFPISQIYQLLEQLEG